MRIRKKFLRRKKRAEVLYEPKNEIFARCFARVSRVERMRIRRRYERRIVKTD